MTSQEISESRVINYDEMIEILVEDGYVKRIYFSVSGTLYSSGTVTVNRGGKVK